MPPPFGVKVPLVLTAPGTLQSGAEELLWEAFESLQSNEFNAAAGFGSHLLRLCVTYMQRNNQLGLDGTFISSNFAQLQTSFGRIECCSLAATPEVHLWLLVGSRMQISCRRFLLFIIRTLQWVFPERERGECSPCGWWLLLYHPAWEGTHGQDHCIIHAALASPRVGFVSTTLATAARLFAACK